MENTLYDDLELPKNCTSEEIKQKYRILAQIHHPDKGGDSEKFQRIKYAYDTLGDPEKRAHYDSTGQPYDSNGIDNEVYNRLAVMVSHFSNIINPEFDDLILKMKVDIYQAQQQTNMAIEECHVAIKKFTTISKKIKLKKDGENFLKSFVEQKIKHKKYELVMYDRALLVFNKMLDVLENYHYSNDEWQLLLENVDGPA